MTTHETVKAALAAALLFLFALAIGYSAPRPRDEHVPRLTRAYCPSQYSEDDFALYMPCAVVEQGREIDL